MLLRLIFTRLRECMCRDRPVESGLTCLGLVLSPDSWCLCDGQMLQWRHAVYLVEWFLQKSTEGGS